MQQLTIVFCLLLLSCSKDDAKATSSGTWTVGGETFTAIDHGRGPNIVQWFDGKYDNGNTTDRLNSVVLEFSEEVPMADTTFGLQRIAAAGVNICSFIRVNLEGNTPNIKTYQMHNRIRGQQSIGSVFTENGKRYMNINPMKVYQISDAGEILDSTTFSARKLEY